MNLDTETPTQDLGYRGELETCDDCGRRHVSGILCQHGNGGRQ